MNKIFKLSLSKNEGDLLLAKELLKRDKITRQHLINVAFYIGPRSDRTTSKSITKYLKRLPEDEVVWRLYDAVYDPLSKAEHDRLNIKWNEIEKNTKLNCKEQIRGIGFKEAEKSIKILMKE